MSRNFTKEEAERIFSLAAEKQQAKRKEDVNQLSMADLEEVGAAAGIDPAYIREAASDLLRPGRVTETRTFMGFPVELRESHVFPIAFTEENWQKMVDVFVGVYGKTGITREIGTTKRWASEKDDNQMPTHIIAEKEEHGTRITIERKVWPMTLGFGIGSVVNLLLSVVFLTIGSTVGDVEELLIPGGILLLVGTILGLVGTVGVKMMNKSERKRFEQVFNHVESMADSAKDSSDKVQLAEVAEGRISLDSLDDEAGVPDKVRAKSKQKD